MLIQQGDDVPSLLFPPTLLIIIDLLSRERERRREGEELTMPLCLRAPLSLSVVQDTTTTTIKRDFRGILLRLFPRGSLSTTHLDPACRQHTQRPCVFLSFYEISYRSKSHQMTESFDDRFQPSLCLLAGGSKAGPKSFYTTEKKREREKSFIHNFSFSLFLLIIWA